MRSLAGSIRRRARRSRLSTVEALEERRVLAAMPVISEILASNDRTIDDQDGDDSDFIELYNAGDEDMSLNRYYLTDDPEDLQKWRFPDVDLAVGQYLVVFASGKDRNASDSELHTNFRLTTSGEYLALVEPDGQAVAYEYSPAFPQQVEDVSYGIPTGIGYTTLLSDGAAAAFTVPTDDLLEPTEPDTVVGSWLDPNFVDSGWTAVTTGVGYVPPVDPVILADSVSDFGGIQGTNNWHYGVWTENFDSDKIYAASEFGPIASNQFNIFNLSWEVNGTSTTLDANGGTPGDGFFIQWAIRRWESETEGPVTIRGTLADTDPSGTGAVGRIFLNGTEIYQQPINGDSFEYEVTANVQLGDFIDFAIDPGEGDNASGDSTTFTAEIEGFELIEPTEVQMADSSSDWERSDVQGPETNNWYYGVYDRNADPDATYQAINFNQITGWTGNRWKVGEVEVRSTSQESYADANTNQWAVRRWQSPIEGTLRVEYDYSQAANGGDGTTARLYHNGEEIDTTTADGEDRSAETRSVLIENVRVGDVIDLAVDPIGPGSDTPDSEGNRASVDIRVFRVADLSYDIASSVRSEMIDVNATSYLRIPFNVDDLGSLDEIYLDMKYDDGFVAYINGFEVASSNAPDSIAFDSKALSARAVEDSTLTERFDISNYRSAFTTGTNYLQIRGLNSDAADDEFLVLPQLTIGTLTAELDQLRYFAAPTPGAVNGLGAQQVGPLVVESSHTPNTPAQNEPIVVTATVSETFNAVNGVQLTYRVMYGDDIQMAMVDDGLGADETAGDGIYTATIPAGIANPGEMVRWYISSNDVNGLTGRLPKFESTRDEEWLGTIIDDPSATSNLPIFHLFLENFTRGATTSGSYGSIFYDGEFYSSVHFSQHGQSSSGFSTPKKSMNVDFPNDHRFRREEGAPRVDDINMLTNYADKSKLRNTLGYEQRAMTGGAYHLAYSIHVRNNGEFYAVYDFVEDPDDRFLDRLGFDPNGELYKIYDGFTSVGTAEKKNGLTDDKDSLNEVIQGVRGRNGVDALTYVMDNVNIAQMVNFEVGFAITSNRDCCHKNYYAYQDTHGTGEWWFLPWDVDLSQGRNWVSQFSYFDDTITATNPLYNVGTNSTLIQQLHRLPEYQEMYYRRLSTLMDTYIKAPGTPMEDRPFETRVEELRELMREDATRDNELNPSNWGQTGFQTFDEAIDILLNEYLEPRREFLYGQMQFDPSSIGEVIVSGEPGATTGSYFIPTDESLGRSWTQPDFDDSSWESGPLGIGFENSNDNYEELIQTDLGTRMTDPELTSLYVRVPFQVDDPSDLDEISLRLKFEDGIVAYLNGTEVYRTNVRNNGDENMTFDDRGTGRSQRTAVEYENINISQFSDQLVQGENWLAFQVLNATGTSSDLFVLPELVKGAVVGSPSGNIPAPQRGNPTIDFGTIEFNPSSGNQQEEYIVLTNNNEVSVDLSGWTLGGAIQHTLDPGTVLVSGASIYLTPDARAFRARAEGPSGGQQLWVQGNYEGLLPNVGGTVELYGSDGQLVSTATYSGEVDTLQQNLRITEVMYNPSEASAAELGVDNSLVSDDFEFIELQNTSTDTNIELTGARFTEGIRFDFTGAAVTELAPGERVLVVRNLEAFTLRYGADAAARVAGEFADNTALQDGGEMITLLTGDGSLVSSFSYGDTWHEGWAVRADGAGSSLEVIDANGDYNEPTNWRASSRIHGSPGAADDSPVNGLFINELLSRPVDPAVDQIEIYNAGGSSVSLSNFFLSDSADDLTKFSFGNRSIAAGGYLVLTEADFNADGDANGFGLNGDQGESLYLTVGDANGPSHFVDDVFFGGAASGESFARPTDGTGWLYPALENTFGQTNSGPRVGPLLISEVNYNPGEPSAEALALYADLESSDLEYVELHNPTSQAVDLTEWRIRLGVDFDFDAGTILGADQTLLVLAFNPDNVDNVARLNGFRAHYGLNESVQLVGGLGGQLSNSGEGVRLVRPGTPPVDEPDAFPRLLEDEVVYDTIAPWTSVIGQSLQRTAIDAYGNLASSWLSAAPTPGVFVGGDGLPGDFNGDSVIDIADVELLRLAVLSGDTSKDLTGDGAVDLEDTVRLVEVLQGGTIGDVNGDLIFNSSDIVAISILGEYQDAIDGNSTYAEGDWNMDGDFTSSDFVFALQRGGYTSATMPPAFAAVATQRTDLDLVAAARPDDWVERTGDEPLQLDRNINDADETDSKSVLLELASHDAIFERYEGDAWDNPRWAADDREAETEVESEHSLQRPIV